MNDVLHGPEPPGNGPCPASPTYDAHAHHDCTYAERSAHCRTRTILEIP
jgi:hypothetical protein